LGLFRQIRIKQLKPLPVFHQPSTRRDNMLFVVQFEDIYGEDPERLPERAKHMPNHLAWRATHSDKVVASGALRDAPESQSVGGIWIVNVPDKASAEALYKEDPFWKAGLPAP
jgi:uncharacterized protein YciI